MSIYTLQATFSRGEITPRLHSRADIDHWRMALKECTNYFVMRHGGLQKRAGTVFVSEVKDSAKQTRLIPFSFSTEQSYVIELGDQYTRFYANQGRVESGGLPVEETTPYLEAQIFDVQYAQSADVLYLAHQAHPQATLSRTSATVFTHANITFTNAPAAWAASNYPRCVSFYQERLAWASTPNEPQTIWLSKAGALTDFGVSTPVVDDDAITVTILAGEVNAIRWLVEGPDLLIGTTGAARTLGPSDRGIPFSATNLNQRRHSKNGAFRIQPVQVGSTTLFISRYQTILHEYLYSFESDGYVAPELTLLSEHILRRKVVDMAYAQDPESIIWMVLASGELAALTYDREQQIVGLTVHRVAGTCDGDDWGHVESVATIPGDEEDEVWLIVRRTINGQTKRYVEYLSGQFEPENTIEDAFFVDCGLTYLGAATNTVTGLSHLEGEAVTILADGAVKPSQVVSGGSVSLPAGQTAEKIHVGLGYKASGRTLPLAVSRGDGSGLGRPKKVSNALIDLLASGPLKVSGIGREKTQIGKRSGGDAMDAPPPLITGFQPVQVDTSWRDNGEIAFESDLPLPSMIRSITLNFDTSP